MPDMTEFSRTIKALRPWWDAVMKEGRPEIDGKLLSLFGRQEKLTEELESCEENILTSLPLAAWKYLRGGGMAVDLLWELDRRWKKRALLPPAQGGDLEMAKKLLSLIVQLLCN